jgi:poly(A) polymerase
MDGGCSLGKVSELRCVRSALVTTNFSADNAARATAIPPVALEIGQRFADAGYELSLVGGWVRDAIMGRTNSDLDFTTNATPEQVLAVLSGWAETTWDVGIRFGTVGASHSGQHLEITTYRAEQYVPDSRKPSVNFGTDINEDLLRRDFTINAMALSLPDGRLHDPFGGLNDIAAGVIRTPNSPEESFSDDPLRMMRAARFAAQLGFEVAPEVIAAMTAMSSRIEIISAERVRDELSKLLLAPHPRRGLLLLVDSGLAQYVLPELPKLQLEIDEHHRHKDVYEHSLIVLEQAIDLETSHDPVLEPDLTLRLAALLHDIGKPKTRRFESGGGVSFHHHEVVGAKLVKKRLTALRFSNEIIDDVTLLVELHLRFHGYGSGEWTDSAVRRYVRDAGSQLARLHKLTRADCTTRNRRKAEALSRTYDELEMHIAHLQEQEELNSIRPDLDGAEIMEILGISPGPVVGKAYKYLLELRLDNGPLSKDDARTALLTWWSSQQ